MRRFAIAAVVFLGVLVAFAGVTQAAPTWSRSAGLDFWNLGDEAARLQTLTTEREELDSQGKQVLRWLEVTDHVAVRLFEDNLTFPEAIEALMAIARAYPEWFARLQSSYSSMALVLPTATERDVLVRYLRVKIETMHLLAEQEGDATRAAAIFTRLTQLNEELGRPGRESSAIASSTP